MRAWEVWNEQRVKELLNRWGFPHKKLKHHDELMSQAARLVVGESVLDVACGCGHLRSYLPDRTQYTGIDISDDMLEVAKYLNSCDTFRKGDIYDLSKFGIYDTVYAVSLLIHLPASYEPLEQLWKHTKKALIFSVYIRDQEKIEIKNNGTIYKYETKSSLERMFNKLRIPNVEKYSFVDPNLSYTYIFRLRR